MAEFEFVAAAVWRILSAGWSCDVLFGAAQKQTQQRILQEKQPWQSISASQGPKLLLLGRQTAFIWNNLSLWLGWAHWGRLRVQHWIWELCASVKSLPTKAAFLLSVYNYEGFLVSIAEFEHTLCIHVPVWYQCTAMLPSCLADCLPLAHRNIQDVSLGSSLMNFRSLVVPMTIQFWFGIS